MSTVLIRAPEAARSPQLPVEVEAIPPGKPRSSWFARRRQSSGDEREATLRRLEDTRLLLEDAREALARGWVREGWYVTVDGRKIGSPAGFRLEGLASREVAGACLVGALLLALQRRDPGADVTVEGGPAVDFVWEALLEARGLGGTWVTGRAAGREIRVIRLRDIVRWNDRPGRTQEQVLCLLDAAIRRVILSTTGRLARGPAGR